MPVPLLAVAIEADGLPVVTWRCRRCDRRTAHVCTERFRVNANGQLLDVWLLYRCARCDATRKLPVAERVRVGSIDVAALDPADVARAVDRLRRAGAGVDGDRFVVAGAEGWSGGPARLALVFPRPLLVRLEDVVAACLGVSRSALRRLAAGGAVAVDSGWPAARRLRLWASATVEVRGQLEGRNQIPPRPGRR